MFAGLSSCGELGSTIGRTFSDFNARFIYPDPDQLASSAQQ